MRSFPLVGFSFANYVSGDANVDTRRSLDWIPIKKSPIRYRSGQLHYQGYAKIKNRRKDQLHKFSTMLTQEYGAIFVGNVSSSKPIKTKMAKSTLDAGWSSLKTLLEYQSDCAGVMYEQVNESYTTQTCSCCGSIAVSSPKGRAGLGIREWTCSDFGSVNDRDLNAAGNILARGHERLVVGIPCLSQ